MDISKIIAAHANATGTWTSAEWTHETDVPGHEYCDGDARGCSTCRDAVADAKAAEVEATKAVASAVAGRIESAVDHASAAQGLEMGWGDDPTWRPLLEACEAARDS